MFEQIVGLSTILVAVIAAVDFVLRWVKRPRDDK
jgi:hypothetical protein